MDDQNIFFTPERKEKIRKAVKWGFYSFVGFIASVFLQIIFPYGHLFYELPFLFTLSLSVSILRIGYLTIYQYLMK